MTPDSFSDGGDYSDVGSALHRAETMVAEGASVLDVGGESTRFGAETVSVQEEIRRVVPVIEELAAASESGLFGGERFRISVDTRNRETAQAAVKVGASLLNDVTASMWEEAAELGVGWVAMHMQGRPQTMQVNPAYADVVDEVRRFLAEKAELAEAAGVEEVWVDPGIGFGKTISHNVALLANLDRIVADGVPLLIGTSRKNFLGTLATWSDAGGTQFDDSADWAEHVGQQVPTETDDRLEGSLVSASWAMIQGAQMFRVHDVASTRSALAAVAAVDVAPKE